MRFIPVLLLVVNGAISLSTRRKHGNGYIIPNLYFIGASKCGTTSLMHVLTKHPLISTVGNSENSQTGESHILDNSGLKGNVAEIKRLETERVRAAAQKAHKDLKLIEQSGIVLHYTPHYIMSPSSVMHTICTELETEGQHCADKKYLVVLRDPSARAVSSWWYKSWCYKNGTKCPPLLPQLEDGLYKADKLDKCVLKIVSASSHLSHARSSVRTSRGALFTHIAAEIFGNSSATLTITNRSGHRSTTTGTKTSTHDLGEGARRNTARTSLAHGLELTCPLTMLRARGSRTLYDAHVGKSLYAQQLARWFMAPYTWIRNSDSDGSSIPLALPRDHVYVMVLETFQSRPLQEMHRLFAWLGLPLLHTYGETVRPLLENSSVAVANAYQPRGSVRSISGDVDKSPNSTSRPTGTGLLGFKSEAALYNFTTQRYNVHPIPVDVYREQVSPVLSRLQRFFEPSIRDLALLLCADRLSRQDQHALSSGGMPLASDDTSIDDIQNANNQSSSSSSGSSRMQDGSRNTDRRTLKKSRRDSHNPRSASTSGETSFQWKHFARLMDTLDCNGVAERKSG